jgi:hypothetical protein
MSNATPALQRLAAARAAFAEAGERSQATHQQHSALLVRLSEAQTASATALSDFRAGKITEEVAALRKASSDRDVIDLNALIEQGGHLLAAVDAALTQAQTRAAEAEAGARKEELLIAAAALEKQIKELEATFLSAIAERDRVQRALNPRHNGSTFGYYQPTLEMQELVKSNTAPTA